MTGARRLSQQFFEVGLIQQPGMVFEDSFDSLWSLIEKSWGSGDADVTYQFSNDVADGQAGRGARAHELEEGLPRARLHQPPRQAS